MNDQLDIYDSKEYKKSGFAYKMECTFEYFVAILVADAYLSNMLTAIGMPDSMVGIVSSITSLAFCFQLITMLLVQRVTNTKMFASLVHLVGRMFFVTLYFIPFFDFIPDESKRVVAVVCIVAGYFGNYVVTSMIYNWGNSFVHPTKRATFSATKEMISLACGMVFTFAMGQVVDYYDARGNSNAAFIFLGLTILVATIADFACLMIMSKENKPKEKVEVEPIRKVIKHLFKNKGFVYLLILDCLHKTAMYSIAGFMGTFKLRELGMTVGLVSIVSMISNGARFAVSKPFGRFSDKTSFATGITLGLIIEAAGYIFVLLAKPELWWMIIGYQVFYNVSTAATSQNFLNAVYSYVDKEHFVQAVSIKNCCSGVIGFLASLGGGAIVRAIQGESGEGLFSLFGIELYAQQILAIIALALTILAFIFAQCVVRKQKVMVQ